jgi:hypothetical protein
MNLAGDVITAWQESSGGFVNLYARRYKKGTGWGSTALVDTENLGDVMFNAVAIDPNGNALVVWLQHDGAYANVWQRSLVGSTGSWQAAAKVETVTGSAAAPAVAMDASGNALVIWAQASPSPWRLWFRRYSPSAGWATAALLDTQPGEEGVNDLLVAFDSAGAATAVWTYVTDQQASTPTDLFASRWTSSAGWSPRARLEMSDNDDAGSVALGVDASGNAIAVWVQNADGTATGIWTSRYRASSGRWGMPTVVEDVDGFAFMPSFAVNEDGNGVAVWSQTDGTRYNIRARRFSPSSNWNPTTNTIESESNDVFEPKVAIDGRGNAFAVFIVETPSGYLTARNEYYVATGWNTATVGPPGTTPGAVATNPNGAAAYLWPETSGPSGTLRARLFE